MPTTDSAAGAGTLRRLLACAATLACAVSVVKRTTMMSRCSLTAPLLVFGPGVCPFTSPVSVDRLGGGVGGGGAVVVNVDECEFLFVREGGVDERLDVVTAGRGKLDVEEEAD